jgi:23S rRNA pseudouridine2605 synthase
MRHHLAVNSNGNLAPSPPGLDSILDCRTSPTRQVYTPRVRPPRQIRTQRRPKKQPGSPTTRVGLARALSKLGFCSRSHAAALIRSGRVTLNATVRRNPEVPVHLNKDHIEVDGQPIQPAEKLYVILNKPRGIVTTASDEKGRQTVYDILPASLRDKSNWLAPVGRLDKASEGLLLLTNDSEWAARITEPNSHLDKIYHVQIGTIADDVLLKTLTNGISHDGEHLRAKQAKILRQGEHNSWLEIVLDEGKNRHIRRMLESQQIEVLRLVRVAIGPLQLGDLAKGAARTLSAAHKTLLDQALQKNSAVVHQ